jgi:amidase
VFDDDGAFDGVATQAERVRRGEVSARELVERALDRIERIDGELNAFGVVFAERALADADRVDERRARGESGPLLGVPVAVKDEIDIAGEVTSRGTGAITARAAADAEVVRRLRDAGAIVVGKTTMPELGLWPFTESITWGVTRNPWDLERTPGGSSGGSAAAVAARASCRRPSASTARVRSGSRLPAAASSVSSPSRVVFRVGRTTATAAIGSASGR